MRRDPTSWWLLVCSGVTFGGCLFDPRAAEGLACRRDSDCGPKLECHQEVCRDPADIDDDDDDGDSTATSGPTPPPPTAGEEGPACVPAGTDCRTGTCCEGSSCVQFTFADGTAQSLCSATCGLGGDCVSCCCQTTDLGEHICAFSDFCEGAPSSCPGGGCGLGGSPCLSDADCCQGVCAGTVGGDQLCFTPCYDASECRSGCCSDVGSSTPGQGFCQPTAVCEQYGFEASGIGDFAAMAARP